ncbi:hypothetical protein [Azospirillum agricola]|uniref:hypothetical protein n=1 Tax=Azospirillum agricola TaxID=1720247 RepID=UPI00117758B3|nr:hypothetical protein [Azospirillum agricola]
MREAQRSRIISCAMHVRTQIVGHSLTNLLMSPFSGFLIACPVEGNAGFSGHAYCGMSCDGFDESLEIYLFPSGWMIGAKSAMRLVLRPQGLIHPVFSQETRGYQDKYRHTSVQPVAIPRHK